MFTIDSNPPAFASRAVGILEGHIKLDPTRGEKAIILVTPDEAEIPGNVHGQAAEAIIHNPLLLAVPVRVIAYPRTRKNFLEILVVNVEEAGKTPSHEKDFFLIQGWNLGSRVRGMSQIAIRPNKKTRHHFEKFWLSLHGHLKENMKCVYQLRALRKGRKLFIVESAPILPPQCTPQKRKLPARSVT